MTREAEGLLNGNFTGLAPLVSFPEFLRSLDIEVLLSANLGNFLAFCERILSFDVIS